MRASVRPAGDPVFVDNRGYMMVAAPHGHPHARCRGGGDGSRGGSRGYIRRSRYVMECHLGRYLAPTEIVHHINEDKLDDRIENLQLMTMADHARHHINNPQAKPGARFAGEPCRRCSATLLKRRTARGLCCACYLRARRSRVNGQWPDWALFEGGE